jgi:hypothetical protein
LKFSPHAKIRKPRSDGSLEKAGVLPPFRVFNIQENPSSSKPLEDFLRQFTPSGSTSNGESMKKSASAEMPAAAR